MANSYGKINKMLVLGVCFLFVCLFDCWSKPRKTILRLLCWEGSKPPGSDYTRWPPAAMSERWLQVCRVKISFELLLTICLVSTTTNSMKCLVNRTRSFLVTGFRPL